RHRTRGANLRDQVLPGVVLHHRRGLLLRRGVWPRRRPDDRVLAAIRAALPRGEPRRVRGAGGPDRAARAGGLGAHGRDGRAVVQSPLPAAPELTAPKVDESDWFDRYVAQW